jgi:hypothetical protein
MPHAFQVHAGAAKAGIDMMMKNLALEWGATASAPTASCPGPIEGTEGAKRLTSRDDQAALIETVPLRRMGSDDDIGQTAVFLASPFGLLHQRLRRRLRWRTEPAGLGAIQYRRRAVAQGAGGSMSMSALTVSARACSPATAPSRSSPSSPTT